MTHISHLLAHLINTDTSSQTFDMADSLESTLNDLGAALPEVTNQGLRGPPRDEAKAKLALEKGWVPQVQYNYEATIAPLTQREPRANDNTNPDATSAVNLPDGEELPGWMHRAKKYEWKDDYGDLAPEIPELEKELFGSELRMRKGHRFDV